jgi:CO/xanthine dehydrogenase FAD-binding subunit
MIEGMMICLQYVQPRTLQEAVAILNQFNGGARILAGGTDLMIDLKTDRKSATVLVDISRINGLDGINIVEGNVCIGARVTHSQASRSEILRKETPVLSEACSTVGSPQIRNMGTLVGNIVNAMPAADGATALIALGARAKVTGRNGQERIVPVEGLYRGPGQSAIDSTREFIPLVEFPIPGPRSGSSFQRLARRKALSLPVLNVATFIRLDSSFSAFEEVRMVVGPASPVPFRSKGAEALLMGSAVTEEVIRHAGERASQEASLRTSLRGGKEYRREMVKVLVERSLRQALVRIHPKFTGI